MSISIRVSISIRISVCISIIIRSGILSVALSVYQYQYQYQYSSQYQYHYQYQYQYQYISTSALKHFLKATSSLAGPHPRGFLGGHAAILQSRPTRLFAFKELINESLFVSSPYLAAVSVQGCDN